MKILFSVISILFFLVGVSAQTTTSQVLEPLTKIQGLIQAALSGLAVIALSIAGAMYFFAGNNLNARDNAKNMFTYAIIGLVIVNLSPLLVSYLLGTA